MTATTPPIRDGESVYRVQVTEDAAKPSRYHAYVRATSIEHAKEIINQGVDQGLLMLFGVRDIKVPTNAQADEIESHLTKRAGLPNELLWEDDGEIKRLTSGDLEGES